MVIFNRPLNCALLRGRRDYKRGDALGTSDIGSISTGGPAVAKAMASQATSRNA